MKLLKTLGYNFEKDCLFEYIKFYNNVFNL